MQSEEMKPPGNKMTIEELAAASQLTVRNIRAYQSRGILPSPRMQGRKGFYGPDHLQRLKHVAALQQRGYSLAAIQDILGKIDPEDLDPGMLAVLSAWKDRNPLVFSRREFEERFPFFFEDRPLLQRMQATGHVAFRGEKVVVAWPALFEVATTLHNMGAVLEPFIALMERTQNALQEIARDVLQTFINDVLHKREDTDDPEVVAGSSRTSAPKPWPLSALCSATPSSRTSRPCSVARRARNKPGTFV